MKLSEAFYMRQIDKALHSAPVISTEDHPKLVLFSDCHRGTGTWSDSFLNNKTIYEAALGYYFERGFTYIELGDGDELWENPGLKRIVEIHSDAFWMMSRFYKQGRFIQLYGNHDRRKSSRKFVEAHCGRYCDSRDCIDNLLSGLKVLEGVVLEESGSGREILLVHGHQGDFLNDTLWRLSAFLVRFVWRKLELLGVYDPTSAAENYNRRKNTEKRLEEWAEKRGVMVIAGHTHRPVLPAPGESLYLNDGSCVHPRCITALELENGRITLVKWSVKIVCAKNLSVEREILAGPYSLQQYWLSK